MLDDERVSPTVNPVTVRRRNTLYSFSQDAIWTEGQVMTWSSDSKWVLIYTILAALLIYSWAVVPA